MFRAVKKSLIQFGSDNCAQMAAALAYYTVFCLPPLLVISITIASYVSGMTSLSEGGAARKMIEQEARQSLGDGAADQLSEMIDLAATTSRSNLGTIAGVAVFLFGASGVMLQLQTSLNQIWNARPYPTQSGVKVFLLKRLLSFAMVLGVGFILLVSMAISSVLAALGERLNAILPSGVDDQTPLLMNGAFDLIVSFLLFAALLRWLPDAVVGWKEACVGALVTALMFVAGKAILAFYFSQSDLGSSYGSAGSLALILAWIYYSGMIFFFGAELTHAVAIGWHGEITPEAGAVIGEKGHNPTRSEK